MINIHETRPEKISDNKILKDRNDAQTEKCVKVSKEK